MDTPAMTERQFRRVLAALIVFAALLAYANTFANEFVWDDASSVLLHEDVQAPSHFLQLFTKDQHAYGRGQGNFYRPLVSVSFMAEAVLSRLFGPEIDAERVQSVLSPFVFHIGNCLWHAFASIALFALMTAFGAPRAVRAIVPLLYVVHPLHTEAVAYISGRADPMAAAFVFTALACAVALPAPRNAVLCGVAFVAALLSKESATIFPFLLLLAALVLRRMPNDETGAPAPRRGLLAPLAISGVLLGVYAALRYTVLNFAAAQAGPSTPLAKRIAEGGQAFAMYLKLIFAPVGLHMERTLDGVSGGMAAVGWLAIAVVLVLAIGAYGAKRGRLAFALSLFLITWLPISGIFPLNAPMAEHWMYVPLAGFVWALTEIAWMALGSTPLRYPLYAACYVAFAALVTMTVERNHDWRSNEALYAATLEQNPNSLRVNYNLGVTYEDLLDNPSGARRQFERVLALYRDRKQAEGGAAAETFYDEELEAHLSLGKIYASRGMLPQAAAHFDTLRRVAPGPSNEALISNAYIEYSKLLAAAGRPEDAQKLFEEGAARLPALKQRMEAIDRLRQSAPEGAPARSATR